MSSAGDVNGDGYADLIVGAPTGGGGKAYVVFGKASGFAADLDMTAIASPDGFRILGEAAGNIAGWSVSSAGDINGDGYDDLMVGAPNFGAGNQGAGYIIFGSPTIGGSVDNVDFEGHTFATPRQPQATRLGRRPRRRPVRHHRRASCRRRRDVMHGGQGNDLMEGPDLAFLLADGGRPPTPVSPPAYHGRRDFRKLQEMETIRLAEAVLTSRSARTRPRLPAQPDHRRDAITNLPSPSTAPTCCRNCRPT